MKLKIFILACLSFLSSIAYAQLPNASAPGFVAPGGYDTCFDYMGAVSFSSKYRFITGKSAGVIPGWWEETNVVRTANKMVGFSIPLVADLDGDGYPEIIGLGASDNLNGELTGYYASVQIYNGQTGALLAKLPFYAQGNTITPMGFLHNEYHGSPSPMALIDSDRDKIVEFIIGFPNTGYTGTTTNYINRLVSYNLIPTRDGNGKTTGYTMTEKWKSAAAYNTGGSTGTTVQANYEKPVPTVVDLDGDAVAEVVVYNKVYNAQTGTLLCTLETLNHSTSTSRAYVGYDAGAYYNDPYIGFNYVYDMDFDGTYDIVAGGKFYKMKKTGDTFDYTVYTASDASSTIIPDGRTGVADINGDGIPDIVSVSRPDLSTIRIVVWNPNFLIKGTGENIISNPDSPVPAILADVTFAMNRGLVPTGSNSYVYIGDIDGREQVVGGKTYRLPEIAILSGRLTYNFNPLSANYIVKHPNVAAIATGGIPTSGTSGRQGEIVAFTWDADASVPVKEKLKLSFVLEHSDRSANTGFTMFDFDNDGVQEICYRDEQTLRILKAAVPFVPLASTDPKIILFNKQVQSYTGFEYPVIADIDNDASAEIVVMGNNYGQNNGYTVGFIYALGNGTGDKFAPALPVWNQFMYDPFKINANLQTPTGPAPNRLAAKYTLPIKKSGETDLTAIKNYQPYNGTLAQSAIFSLGSETIKGEDYDNVYEPIVFLTAAYIQDTDNAATTAVYEAPYIDLATGNLIITVGNKSGTKTDVSQNTPIVLYENSILPTQILKNGVYSTRKTFTITLADFYIDATITAKLSSPIKAGTEVQLRMPLGVAAGLLTADPLGYYIVRLGDASAFTAPVAPDVPVWVWSFGYNKSTDTPIVGMDGVGLAQRAYRDCSWTDQTAKVAAFRTRDDASTVANLGSVEIDVLGNDHLPTSYAGGIGAANIVPGKEPKDGMLIYSNGKITYQSKGLVDLPTGIDQFTYSITYINTVTGLPETKESTVYVFVLKTTDRNFVACSGSPYILTLRTLPTGVTYNWYADATSTTTITPTLNSANVSADLHYYVEPRTAAVTAYNNIVFPRAELVIKAVPQNTLLKWTGKVSSNWNNAANWLEVNRSTLVETATSYTPGLCTDVIISTVDLNSYYPVLLASDVCQAQVIRLADRAMLQNSFRLSYTSVAFDFTFKASETNRWFLYSTPFSDLFSGDFTTKNAAAKQNPRATYISLFEAANPDKSGSSAVAKTFCQPFGKVDQPLTFGGAYMLYVDTQYDAVPKLKIDQAYSFSNLSNTPLGAAERTPSTVAATRPQSVRFIYESASYTLATGIFSFTYPAFSTYILITNPFPAYLDLQAFLTANSSVLMNSYKIWNGTAADTFITRTTGAGSTWKISDAVTTLDAVPAGTKIAPFQSFFVQRKNATGPTTVTYNPSMTSVPAEAGGYILK